MKAPVIKRNTSIPCVTLVTWNKPLYNPNPDPIACTYKALNDSAALKSSIIEVIRVSNVGVIVDEYSGIAINSEVNPIKSIQVLGL